MKVRASLDLTSSFPTSVPSHYRHNPIGNESFKTVSGFNKNSTSEMFKRLWGSCIHHAE